MRYWWEIIRELRNLLLSGTKERKQSKFDILMLELKQSPYLAKNKHVIDRRFFNQIVEPLAEEVKGKKAIPYAYSCKIGKEGSVIETGKQTPVKTDYKSLGSRISKKTGELPKHLKESLQRLSNYHEIKKKKERRESYKAKDKPKRFRKAKKKFAVKFKRLLQNSPIIEERYNPNCYWNKEYVINPSKAEKRRDNDTK